MRDSFLQRPPDQSSIFTRIYLCVCVPMVSVLGYSFRGLPSPRLFQTVPRFAWSFGCCESLPKVKEMSEEMCSIFGSRISIRKH